MWVVYILLVLASSMPEAAVALDKSEDATYNIEYEHVPSQLIVKFKMTINTIKLDQLLSKYNASIIKRFKSNGALLLYFDSIISDYKLFTIARSLDENPEVEYVEANTLLYLDEVPNDELFSKQYGINNDGQTGGKVDADIDAPEAWNIATGNRKNIVAVIDTGINYLHPDLAENYWFNAGELGTDINGRDKRSNGVDDDGNGFVDDYKGWDFANNDNDPMDDHGHGSQCAGIIGARGNNTIGVSGVNWQAAIVAIKFFRASGSGTLDHAISAIEYAIDLNVKIANNSWSGREYSETLKAAIAKAEDSGMLIVAAAGNNGLDTDLYPRYPSSFNLENIISVAASEANDNLARFSNFGRESVDIAAPGVGIFSTVLESNYGEKSGTSMAAPYVSGVAALLLSKYPQLTALELKNIILMGSDPIDQMHGKTVSGGRLNANNAIENDVVNPGPIHNLVIVDTRMTEMKVSWTKAGDDGELGEASRYQVKLSASPINTEQDWQHAEFANVKEFTKESNKVIATISSLPFNSSGFFAVRAVDNLGNLGKISQSLPYAVKIASLLYHNNADSLDDSIKTGNWGIESVGGGNNVFSDSPGGVYQKEDQSYFVMPSIPIVEGELILLIDIKYEFEINFDFGHVELSSDQGSSWISLLKLTGRSEWQTHMFHLNDFTPEDARNILVKFKLNADKSIEKDGMQIDNIKIYKAVN
ncbi:MAG: S8 family serine peptidase [Bdellovibrionota bacterium]